MRLVLTLAALSGFLAVAFGAFAAHGISDPQATEWLKTGAHYQLVHALAVFACAVVSGRAGRPMRLAPSLFLAGGLLFAGSLYAMAFGAPRWFGAITPLGGLCLLAGWLLLARAAWKSA